MNQYPEREIYMNGRYVKCQILTPWTSEPPKYIACNPLHEHFSEPFIAAQRMGTWMKVDIFEIAKELNDDTAY